MILECTDCTHCISYGFGFRIACGHPDLQADEVYKYHPVGDKNAELCSGFEEGEPEVEIGEEEINAAVEMYGDDVSSLRKYASRQAMDEDRER